MASIGNIILTVGNMGNFGIIRSMKIIEISEMPIPSQIGALSEISAILPEIYKKYGNVHLCQTKNISH